MPNANIYGTDEADIFTNAEHGDVLHAGPGDDLVEQSGTGGSGALARIDGGEGQDTVAVVIPSMADPLDTFPDFAFGEVDPILFGGYTHLLTHLGPRGDGLAIKGRTLLRDVETLIEPDGTSVATTSGDILWHAETDIQSFADFPTKNNLSEFSGRTVASLADGNVVRIFQSAETGSDHGKLGFLLIDGDGDVVLNSDLFGFGTRTLFNPFESQMTLGHQVTALDDGGFAVAYMERSETRRSGDSEFLVQIKAQLFDANGELRGDPLVIFGDRPNRDTVAPTDISITTMEDGNFLISLKTDDYVLVESIYDLDGKRLDSIGYEPGFFPTDHTAVALPGGYVSIYIDHSLRDRNNDKIEQLIARHHTVDATTGEITFTKETALHAFEPGVGTGDTDYVALGNGNFAAAVQFGTEIVLVTYIDGTVTSQNPLPGEYRTSNSGVSLTQSVDGGAYLAFEAADYDNIDGAVLGPYAMMITIGQDGTLGTPTNMSRNFEQNGNNLRPVIAETSDGVIAFWENSSSGTEWISYQAVDGYSPDTGSGNSDTLTGSAADDRVSGLQGDDLLVQSAGIDRFDGGEGIDTFSVNGSGAHVLSLADGYAAPIDSISREALINIENLIGSDEGDRLIGDRGANRLEGNRGNDTITSNGGQDTIRGGAGEDTYLALAGKIDYLLLDEAASVELLDLSRPVSQVEGALELIDSGGIIDLRGVTSYVAADDIKGGNGNDTITGTQASDTIDAGGSDDRIDGQAGNDVLMGGSGSDTLIGGAGDDVLTGGGSSSAVNTFMFGLDFGNDRITDYQSLNDVLDFSAFTQSELAQMEMVQQGDDRVATFHDGSTLTLENTARNFSPSGRPSISGEAREGATLGVDLSTLSDRDGFLLDGSFQWQRDGEDIIGATSETYLLGQEDVGARMTVVYRYTDLFQTQEEVTSSRSGAVQNVNDAPEGAVVIAGTATDGNTLTVDTADLSDEDGLGTFAYQWQRDGNSIAGANDESYSLGQGDVGSNISVRVSYTDGFGAAESVTSVATSAVENVNDAPAGSVAISGSAEQGETLMADATAISDEDGLGTFAYQWQRNGNNIAGANGESYSLGEDDVGAEVAVSVSYTDGQGTAEMLVSAATAAILSDDLILTGTPDADRLIGAEGDDMLSGLDGNDTLIGNAGNDTLIGGTSENDLRDVIYGGAGNDSIDGGYGNDELRGDAGDDTIAGGFGGDTIIGGTGDDVLSSGALGDIIFGGDGDDYINGGFGHDRLNGGAGADEFFHLGIFDHGSDWVQDYNADDGDVLVFGNANATRDQFQINTTETANAGADGIEEAFVIYRPTGQIMWALIDGGGQDEINLRIGGDIFDLTA